MISPSIPAQACLVCTLASGTKTVCDSCFTGLTKSQRQSMDHTFQLLVVEIFGNACVDCGHSAERASGELCADHLETKGADPLGRYDLANAVCRCLPCHNKRHTAEIPKVPKKEKLPKETQEKVEKFKKLAVCNIAGCVFWAIPTLKNPKRCGRHQ